MTADDDSVAREEAALEAQRRRLRSLEDPANTSSTAVTYREMVEAADVAIRAAGERLPVSDWSFHFGRLDPDGPSAVSDG